MDTSKTIILVSMKETELRMATAINRAAAPSPPGIFHGWFVVAGALAVSYADFG